MAPAGHHARIVFLLALIAVVVLGGLAAYVFVLAPPLVAKPALEKPLFLSTQGVPVRVEDVRVSQSIPSTAVAAFDERHLQYLLVEAGVYRLHSNPFTNDVPEMELRFPDVNKVFTATITGNAVQVRTGGASEPDFRVELDQDILLQLLTAETTAERVRKGMDAARSGKYRARLLTTENDLLLKGYLGVYQALQGIAATGGVTGAFGLPALGTTLFLSYFAALFLLLFVLMLSLQTANGER